MRTSSCNRFLFFGLAIALGGACGASSSATGPDERIVADGPPIPLSVDRPFFIPGEVMRFELSLHNVIGGEAVLAVGHPGRVDGRDVIVVRSQAKSAGVAALFKEVRDDVTTWVDLIGGHPTQLRADVKFGRKEALIETKFVSSRPGRFEIDYTKRGKRTYKLHHAMPDAGTFDAHSMLGVVRAWEAPTNSRSYFYVLAGKRLWKNTMRVAGREKLSTKLGRFDAVRLEGVTWRLDRRLKRLMHKKARNYTVWISEDDKRLPLLVTAKTEYGEVKVELVNHNVAPMQARVD